MKELKHSAVADNTVIGLPYLMIGTKNHKINAFLREGFWLCGLLSEQIPHNTIISLSKIEIHQATQHLTVNNKQIVFDTKSKAKQVEAHLSKCIACDESLTEADAKQIQNFFNTLSVVNTKKAIGKLLVKKEKYK